MPYVPLDRDIWEIPNPEAGRHYRWIAGYGDRLAQWLRSYGDRPGYQLVQGTTLEETRKIAEKLGLSAHNVDVNTNRITNGKNILASIPMEEYERRQAEFKRMEEAQRGAAVDNFHATGENLRGVRTFEEHPDQTADRKAFHTRDDRPMSGQTGIGTSPVLKQRGRRGG